MASAFGAGRRADQNVRAIKKRPLRPAGYTNRPSAVLDARKASNPFSKSGARKNSPFAQAYSDGGVPCRICHGGVKHKLQWDVEPVELDYYPILITFAFGLAETKHPYVFVAPVGFEQLLLADGAYEKVMPLVKDLMRPLRLSLASNDKTVANNALKAVHLLSNLVGNELTQYLPMLLVPIKSKWFKPNFKEKITELLQSLEEQGGVEAYKKIKKKVPTYHSVGSYNHGGGMGIGF
jgi:hypothetical protein